MTSEGDNWRAEIYPLHSAVHSEEPLKHSNVIHFNFLKAHQCLLGFIDIDEFLGYLINGFSSLDLKPNNDILREHFFMKGLFLWVGLSENRGYLND